MRGRTTSGRLCRRAASAAAQSSPSQLPSSMCTRSAAGANRSSAAARPASGGMARLSVRSTGRCKAAGMGLRASQ